MICFCSIIESKLSLQFCVCILIFSFCKNYFYLFIHDYILQFFQTSVISSVICSVKLFNILYLIIITFYELLLILCFCCWFSFTLLSFHLCICNLCACTIFLFVHLSTGVWTQGLVLVIIDLYFSWSIIVNSFASIYIFPMPFP
jgi:hypothetical protein